MASSALSRVDSSQATQENESQAPTYRKLDVPESQTRVLRILPDDADAIIHARLVHIDLNKSNDFNYEAVSYVWSLLTGQKDVVIDGKVCSIPASAEDVLRNVRCKDSERLVWIDAVCINQKDIPEKQHQVSIMGNIYSKSRRTIVWLGEEDGHTMLAFETLRLLYDQASRNSEGCTRLRDVLYGKAQTFQYSTMPLPDSCTNVAMEAVRRLFRRPWFRRRWIIQEVALPPEGIVYCGTQSMPILELFRAAVWIHHKEDHLPFDIQQEDGMLNASYMSARVDSEQGWFSRNHGQKQQLADLFRYFQTFDATVDHDRIYALLGLTQWHIKQHPLPPQIVPAYERPINEVLADATRVATEEAGDLWLFRYIDLAEIPQSNHPPSWVPQLFRGVDPDVDSNHLRSTFNASKGMVTSHLELFVTIDLNPRGYDWRTISAQGFIVDRIQDVGQVITKSDLGSTEAIHRLFSKTVIDKQLITDQGDHIALPPLKATDLGLVLLAGTHFYPEPAVAHHELVSTFKEFISAFCAAKFDSQNKVTALLKSKSSARYIRGLKWAATHRRLFITTDGRFGIGPRAVYTGDVLAVLSASRMPMIMRQSEDKWRVVGPCYVYGIMMGEVVEVWKKLGAAPMTFLLH